MNIIKLQDELIQAVNAVEPNNYNYSLLRGKHMLRFLNQVIELGFSESFAEKAMYEALDMAKLEVVKA